MNGGSGEVTLPAEIDGDTLLSADCSYLLVETTYVISGTTTIEAGTEILGLPDPGEAGGFIVTQNGRIDARGTATRIPLARQGTPEELASLVRFLVAEADFITGQVIPFDGGRSIRM
jgi:NAD(P)-dependent dehydrogenase (short-subunit alcohol dehydrogenase family)